VQDAVHKTQNKRKIWQKYLTTKHITKSRQPA